MLYLTTGSCSPWNSLCPDVNGVVLHPVWRVNDQSSFSSGHNHIPNMSRCIVLLMVHSVKKKGPFMHKLHTGIRILAPPDMHIVYDSTQVECGCITEDEVWIKCLVFQLSDEVTTECHFSHFILLWRCWQQLQLMRLEPKSLTEDSAYCGCCWNSKLSAGSMDWCVCGLWINTSLIWSTSYSLVDCQLELLPLQMQPLFWRSSYKCVIDFLSDKSSPYVVWR